jgi:hypothetical protein
MSGSVLHAAIAPQRPTKFAGFAHNRRAPLWMRRSGLEQLWRRAARNVACVYLFLSLGVGVGVAQAEGDR